MKNIFKTILSLSIIALTFISCSSDDGVSNSSNQFIVDGETYTLPPIEGNYRPVTIVSDLSYVEEGEEISVKTITITGLKGTDSFANLIFPIFYKQNSFISGTYNFYVDPVSGPPTLDEQLIAEGRLCVLPSLVFGLNTGSSITTALTPTDSSTLTVIDNGNLNFTFQYNGMFNEYDNSSNIIGTVPVEMNITTDVVLE